MPVTTMHAPKLFRASAFVSLDAEITAPGGKLSMAREVKQGMMSALLTGKIRLV